MKKAYYKLLKLASNFGANASPSAVISVSLIIRITKSPLLFTITLLASTQIHFLGFTLALIFSTVASASLASFNLTKTTECAILSFN